MCRADRALFQFRVGFFALALLAGVCALPDAAHAAPPVAANPPGYDAAIDEALAAFDRGQFSESRELFLRAHKIFPSARTLRAMGKTEYELKRFDEAAAHLSLALESTVRPLTDQQRRETETLLLKSQDFLATYTLRLEPPSAELRLDGTPVGLDANNSLRLIVGEHVLEAEAPDYEPWQRELSVRPRENTLLAVTLTPLAKPQPAGVAESSQAEDAQQTRDDQPRRRRWLIWTSVGVLVAAGVITGVVLALNRDDSPAAASGGNTGLVWPLDPSKN
jgi:tetratricopeptide (TPR) repeat protein